DAPVLVRAVVEAEGIVAIDRRLLHFAFVGNFQIASRNAVRAFAQLILIEEIEARIETPAAARGKALAAPIRIQRATAGGTGACGGRCKKNGGRAQRGADDTSVHGHSGIAS